MRRRATRSRAGPPSAAHPRHRETPARTRHPRRDEVGAWSRCWRRRESRARSRSLHHGGSGTRSRRWRGCEVPERTRHQRCRESLATASRRHGCEVPKRARQLRCRESLVRTGRRCGCEVLERAHQRRRWEMPAWARRLATSRRRWRVDQADSERRTALACGLGNGVQRQKMGGTPYCCLTRRSRSTVLKSGRVFLAQAGAQCQANGCRTCSRCCSAWLT